VQRALHLRAGGVAAGVHDAVGGVPALAGEQQPARGVAVEGGAPVDELVQPRGPSVTRACTASGSHSPTPATSVSRACASGVSAGSSTAAMPPCAQRVEPSSTRTLVTTATDRPAARACRATHSPATPGADDADVGRQLPARAPGRRAGWAARRPGGRQRRHRTGTPKSLRRCPAHRARGPRGRPPSSTTRLAPSTCTTSGCSLRLGLVHEAVADQDDQVAGVHEVRGGAVDADDAAAALAGDDVGLQAGAVGDVDDATCSPGSRSAASSRSSSTVTEPHVVQVRPG
jgi:hypothetical protein